VSDSSDPIAEALARLVSEAELVSEGEFSIDGEAARAKLAARQLADPCAWLLLVLEAAEVVGSVRVEVLDLYLGVRVRLVGPGAIELAPPGSLERLFDRMFDEVESLPQPERRRGRARQLFAYAINAATASGPKRRVILRARSPEGGRRLTLSGPGKPQLETGRRGEPRLDIDCLDLGNMRAWGFIRDESALVIARAGYGQWPIHVAGRPLPPQPRLGSRHVASELELDGERLGHAALLHAPSQPRLVLVANGVELETVPLPGFSLGFHAVVADAFARDLSLGRAIRDARFDAILTRVDEVHAQLVAELSAARAGGAALARWDGAGTLARVPAAKIKLPEASLWELLAMPAGGAGVIGVVAGIAQELWVLVLLCGVLAYFGGAQALRYMRQRELYGELLDLDGSMNQLVQRIERNRRRSRS